MKNRFAWLCVLLALLLPVQGAVAAAMLCPHQIAHSHPAAEEDVAADDETMDHDGMVGVKAADAQHHGHDDPHAAKCGLCAACCSGAVLAPVWPTAFTFDPTATETFSALPVPATTFQSDGQERPPRSC